MIASGRSDMSAQSRKRSIRLLNRQAAAPARRQNRYHRENRRDWYRAPAGQGERSLPRLAVGAVATAGSCSQRGPAIQQRERRKQHAQGVIAAAEPPGGEVLFDVEHT